MNYKPVATLADLNTLDKEEMFRGYLDFEKDDPEPGQNSTRSYWHGWMNRARDAGERPQTAASRQLAHEAYGRKIKA